MHDTYLGHTAEYWLELNNRVKELGLEELLQENVTLRGQLEFIKSRLEQIDKVIK